MAPVAGVITAADAMSPRELVEHARRLEDLGHRSIWIPDVATVLEADHETLHQTRDVAVAASDALLDAHPTIRPADGADPTLRSLRLAEMYTCWELPVTWSNGVSPAW